MSSQPRLGKSSQTPFKKAQPSIDLPPRALDHLQQPRRSGALIRVYGGIAVVTVAGCVAYAFGGGGCSWPYDLVDTASAAVVVVGAPWRRRALLLLRVCRWVGHCRKVHTCFAWLSLSTSTSSERFAWQEHRLTLRLLDELQAGQVVWFGLMVLLFKKSSQTREGLTRMPHLLYTYMQHMQRAPTSQRLQQILPMLVVVREAVQPLGVRAMTRGAVIVLQCAPVGGDCCLAEAVRHEVRRLQRQSGRSSSR